MKAFLKYVLATVTGILITSFILLIVVIALITSAVNDVSSSKVANVADNSLLYVSLNHVITERTESNPFEELSLPGYASSKSLGLDDILKRIRAAQDDYRIQGVYLNLSAVNVGMASLQEIRDALVDFKKSGKFIVAYSDVYTQKGYFLSSVADKIYLNPEGSLEFRGLSSSVMFMKEALDKLGVDMQVIKVGTYKSAVEPFILNEMSAANREQVSAYLNSTYDSFLANIAVARKLSVDSLRSIADGYLIRNADDALNYKFIDAKLYKDELITALKTRLKVAENKDIAFVSLLDYKEDSQSTESSKDRIAVLYAYGDIVDGESEQGSIGGDTFSRELRKLRKDDRVKAVVLRVNSPGGSALASDIIAREVELTKKVKPIVVSMGDYAASGGYYIAALADTIFAEQATLTGSIGVFGLIPNFKNLLNNKLGIRFDQVKTGKYADLMASPDRPLTAEEKSIIQLEVNRIYDTFLGRVAKGRGLSVAQVDSIGQGRVWTGQQALEIGLVDRIGGLDAAIASAAAKAKLRNYRLMAYPVAKDPFSSLLSTSKEKIKVWMFADDFGDYMGYVNQFKSIVNTSGIQARIPYIVEIH